MISGLPEYTGVAVKVVLPSQAIEFFSALTLTEVTLFSTTCPFAALTVTIAFASFVVEANVTVHFTVTL